MIQSNPTRSRFRSPSRGVLLLLLRLILFTAALASLYADQGVPGAATGVNVAAPLTGGPTILGFTLSASSVARYSRVDATFTLSTVYANPYYAYDPADTVAANPGTMTWVGATGVTVDLVLTAPSAAAVVQPCFYMTDYLRVQDTGVEILGASSAPHWACRFAPAEVGTYQYHVIATDSGGTGRYPTSGELSFTSTASGARGYVRASTADTRFLAYDDGSSFVPIGIGAQWWDPVTASASKSYNYDTRFATAGANGVNFTRVWIDSDFALSVEGASQPNWIKSNTTVGAAEGVEVNTGLQHAGLRAAKPSFNNGWYQRLTTAVPATLHRLTAWVRTDNVAGGTCQVNVRATAGYNTGTVLGQLTAVSGTTAWTQYTTTFTPNDAIVAVNLVPTHTSGTCYVDDVEYGPDGGGGAVTYNEISDGTFERHFFAGNPGNDPNATPSLARPLGTFINPWAAAEMDAIVQAAETNGIAMQLCTCSGPWFTWPTNPGNLSEADHALAWVQHSYQRMFRYLIARWGYSTSVAGWELANEWGHVNSSATPNTYAFSVAINAYLSATDPYHHLRTNSQNSQAYSPQFWSSAGHDISNTHWYLDGHIPSLDTDESLTIARFAECLSSATIPSGTPKCTGLGLGDGSAWTGAARPWVWGEVGVGVDGTQGNTGEAGSRFLHNLVWAGLFTPLGTTPLEWWWYQEDATATAAKLAARFAASTFFRDVPYDTGGLTFLLTPDEATAVTGFTGPQITNTNAVLKGFALRRSDQLAAYLWVQHQDYRYSNAGTPTGAASTMTLPGLLASTSYVLKQYDTTTGLVTATTTVTSTAGGGVAVATGTVVSDTAFKIEIADWPQFQHDAARTGAAPSGTDGSYQFGFAWEGPTTTETTLPLTSSTSLITLAGRVQPVIQNNRGFVGTMDGAAYAFNATTGAPLWTRVLDSAVLTTAAVRYGVVVFATVYGTVYGLNVSTGAIVWVYTAGAAITTSPCQDGTRVYLATHGGTVFALNSLNGELLWATNVNNYAPIEGDLAADAAYVYVGDETMNVHKVNARTGAVLATTRLRGRSFQATNPVIAGGRVWWTSFTTPSQGSEFVAENLFASSGTLAAEEANIALFLAGTSGFTDNSVDWQHRFAVTISSWTQPFPILAMPSEGTGHPPDSMVVDNSGRVITYGKTRYPSLVGSVGNTFGTAYTVDIFAINQTTGARIPLGDGMNLAANNFTWEADNLFALSVAGNELWLNSRFRGTSAFRAFSTSSTRTRVKAYIDTEDGGDFCPTFQNCYKSASPRISTTQNDTAWWSSIVIVGGRVYICENFGITMFQ